MEKFENLKEFLHLDEYFTEEKVVICNSRAEAEALKEKFLLDADFYFATKSYRPVACATSCRTRKPTS